ncbi:MAG TPA: hypothetical protein VM935_12460, partial [Chitinophagaceae bacterium]|nr:hypothetical protein [Chitinophagaceae bacterium]
MRLAPEAELKHANDRYTYMSDMEQCMTKLEEKGFSDQYQVRDGRLCCLNNGKEFLPEDVKALNFYRFEGITNPDDMAILYAIETIDDR